MRERGRDGALVCAGVYQTICGEAETFRGGDDTHRQPGLIYPAAIGAERKMINWHSGLVDVDRVALLHEEKDRIVCADPLAAAETAHGSLPELMTSFSENDRRATKLPSYFFPRRSTVYLLP